MNVLEMNDSVIGLHHFWDGYRFVRPLPARCHKYEVAQAPYPGLRSVKRCYMTCGVVLNGICIVDPEGSQWEFLKVCHV